MRHWLRVEKVGDQYAVLTGFNDSAHTTFMVDGFDAVVAIMRSHFGEVPPVSIFVEEKLTIGEKLK